MKRFIKGYRIFLGTLAIIGAVFFALSYPQNESAKSDRWIEEPDSISGILNSISHIYLSSQDNGYLKNFNSKGSQKFYYNDRHGYFVLLPKELGYKQLGEYELGAHGNEFYNCDTTLVLSCGANFYDVVLLDYPNWEDTIRNNHLEWLYTTGKAQILSGKPNENNSQSYCR